jgi:hypothetical protein
MNVIDLENYKSLSAPIQHRLKECNHHFLNSIYLENIKETPSVAELIEEIDEYCMSNMILGIHYTRAFSQDIMEQGLLLRSGEQIRQQFLERFGCMFNEEELKKIKKVWASYFNEQMCSARDNRIFFNFTTLALHNGGAELLLKNYGGEQIYFCINELQSIGKKISSLGEPLIVKCTLSPSDIHTCIEKPWGSIAVSAYHRHINPNASQIDQDGWVDIPIPPKYIEITHITI